MKAIVFDFSRVLLFHKDKDYQGGLNDLHRHESQHAGYNPFDHFVLNHELLDYLHSVKEYYPLYILTSETIQYAPEFQEYLRPLFKYIYSAQKLGMKKDEKKVYEHIAEEIQLRPEEVVFVDDLDKNLAAAKEAGMQVVKFTSNEEVMNVLNPPL
jgi:HAD superfamily hydrolase (TIGR01549 family)